VNRQYLYIPQRSDEWYAARWGRLTASTIYKSINPGKARKRELERIISERQTGYKAQDDNDSAAMKWGRDNERAALFAYSLHEDVDIGGVGVILCGEMLAASPDGLVGENGIIEIKCPYNPDLHLSHMIYGATDKYMWQMQASIYASGRDYCDFVTFDPRQEVVSMRYHKTRHEKDKKAQNKIEETLIFFENEVKSFFEKSENN
jgi:putative phage-type endonuclease